MLPYNFFKCLDYLKGLSDEMDLAFEDIWSVLSLNRGRGQVLNFLVLQ